MHFHFRFNFVRAMHSRSRTHTFLQVELHFVHLPGETVHEFNDSIQGNYAVHCKHSTNQLYTIPRWWWWIAAYIQTTIYEMIQCESIPICDNICEQHFIYLQTCSVDEHTHTETHTFTHVWFICTRNLCLLTHYGVNWIYKYYMDMFIGTDIRWYE